MCDRLCKSLVYFDIINPPFVFSFVVCRPLTIYTQEGFIFHYLSAEALPDPKTILGFFSQLTQDKHKTCICVQNFGTTIAQEDLPHVFDRFYRSDKSRTNETESFGLGLAITREMVNKIHGEISVTSNPQKGTIFTVTFQR